MHAPPICLTSGPAERLPSSVIVMHVSKLVYYTLGRLKQAMTGFLPSSNRHLFIFKLHKCSTELSLHLV